MNRSPTPQYRAPLRAALVLVAVTLAPLTLAQDPLTALLPDVFREAPGVTVTQPLDRCRDIAWSFEYGMGSDPDEELLATTAFNGEEPPVETLDTLETAFYSLNFEIGYRVKNINSPLWIMHVRDPWGEQSDPFLTIVVIQPPAGRRGADGCIFTLAPYSDEEIDERREALQEEYHLDQIDFRVALGLPSDKRLDVHQIEPGRLVVIDRTYDQPSTAYELRVEDERLVLDPSPHAVPRWNGDRRLGRYAVIEQYAGRGLAYGVHVYGVDGDEWRPLVRFDTRAANDRIGATWATLAPGVFEPTALFLLGFVYDPGDGRSPDEHYLHAYDPDTGALVGTLVLPTSVGRPYVDGWTHDGAYMWSSNEVVLCNGDLNTIGELAGAIHDNAASSYRWTLDAATLTPIADGTEEATLCTAPIDQMRASQRPPPAEMPRMPTMLTKLAHTAVADHPTLRTRIEALRGNGFIAYDEWGGEIVEVLGESGSRGRVRSLMIGFPDTPAATFITFSNSLANLWRLPVEP